MSDYDYETEFDVRFRDFDIQGHVNSAVYSTYCEQARVNYLRDVAGVSFTDLNIAVARLVLDYKAPITEAETVTVTVGVLELGTSSFRLGYELYAEGTLVATAETVQVVFDSETGESTPIPDAWRRRIDQHEGDR